MQVKTAEPPDFNTFTRRQTVAHDVYQTPDCEFDILLSKVLLFFRQDFNQVRPGHRGCKFLRNSSIHISDFAVLTLLSKQHSQIDEITARSRSHYLQNHDTGFKACFGASRLGGRNDGTGLLFTACLKFPSVHFFAFSVSGFTPISG